MFLLLAFLLFLFWLSGAFVIHVGGDLIHILLVIALVVVIWDVLNRRTSV